MTLKERIGALLEEMVEEVNRNPETAAQIIRETAAAVIHEIKQFIAEAE